MKASDYIVDFLIQHGVTDVFGIPGGSVLELLYAFDRKSDNISVHLNYNEHCSGFAATGYAQVSGRLGVAYATKGPGITNLITPIADAYADSIPVLFITAHEHIHENTDLRYEFNQEINTVRMISEITKYTDKVDSVSELEEKLINAYSKAVNGRKGPVFLDILSSVFKENITVKHLESNPTRKPYEKNDEIINRLKQILETARRPIFLVGDGIRQAGAANEMRKLSESLKIPVLSSRCSEDIMADSDYYYGYIGSHGVRYSNFILSKADVIIVLGNRMGFPIKSQSFRPIIENAKILRIDIDNAELQRSTPNAINVEMELGNFFALMKDVKIVYSNSELWLKICEKIREELYDRDVNLPTKNIADILDLCNSDSILCSDVGNNEFWLSRAYVFCKSNNRILYSKSYGALGCSFGKAIGAHYGASKNIICFCGDQGFQVYTQELQYIAIHQLPITIIVINNMSSGMIKSKEKERYNYFLHTTTATGYSVPNIKAVSEAYGIKYLKYDNNDKETIKTFLSKSDIPAVIELTVDENFDLEPFLPNGSECQNLMPKLPDELYRKINEM